MCTASARPGWVFVGVGAVIVLLELSGSFRFDPFVPTHDPFSGYRTGTSQNVAVVIPTFTSAAYVPGGFYYFYLYPDDVSHLTVDPSKLPLVGLQSIWGDSYALYHFLVFHPPQGVSITYLTDQQVDNGSLFDHGVAKYRLVVLGHEEYVTQTEYFQFQAFVATGGVMVDTAANSFWARVTYSRTTGLETLALGHGWAFDGTRATRSSVHPFEARNINWTGAVYCCKEPGPLNAAPNASNPIGRALGAEFGGSVFISSAPQEEDLLRNFTHTSVIADWAHPGVYTYAHRYGKGVFVNFGGFAPSMLLNDASTQRFVTIALSTQDFGV